VDQVTVAGSGKREAGSVEQPRSASPVPLPIPDLSVELCGVKLPNPTVLASGLLGLSAEIFGRLARCGVGAITTKSCSLQPRPGWRNPVIVDWGEGLINAVGLSNPGVEVMVDEIRRAREILRPYGVPVIASIFANSIYDFGAMARYISEARPDLIEVNISCPNLDSRFEEMFAANAHVSAQVTRRVKENTSVPVLIKLSPNVSNLTEIALRVAEAGADGISAINSLGPGLVLDVDTARPVLAHGAGGVSGPAIRPIAVRCVRDICQALRDNGHAIPVLGMGGVTTGRDVVEMLLAGAQAVGIGSAIQYRGIDVFAQCTAEVGAYMAKHGYLRLADFRGKALK
jgi:dihydroorotate dehydrogenase (NAD+) catalytic subunit